jgi:hypothetical protein
MNTLIVCGIVFAIAWGVYGATRSTSKTVLGILGLTVFSHVVGAFKNGGSSYDEDGGYYDDSESDRGSPDAPMQRLGVHLVLYGLTAYAASIAFQWKTGDWENAAKGQSKTPP